MPKSQKTSLSTKQTDKLEAFSGSTDTNVKLAVLQNGVRTSSPTSTTTSSTGCSLASCFIPRRNNQSSNYRSPSRSPTRTNKAPRAKPMSVVKRQHNSSSSSSRPISSNPPKAPLLSINHSFRTSYNQSHNSNNQSESEAAFVTNSITTMSHLHVFHRHTQTDSIEQLDSASSILAIPAFHAPSLESHTPLAVRSPPPPLPLVALVRDVSAQTEEPNIARTVEETPGWVSVSAAQLLGWLEDLVALRQAFYKLCELVEIVCSWFFFLALPALNDGSH